MNFRNYWKEFVMLIKMISFTLLTTWAMVAILFLN
jgi:hypothetical protein